jgi:hypothetical protein
MLQRSRASNALDWTAHIAGWFAALGGVSTSDAKLPPSNR